jgi:CHAT domain-containing protein
VKALEYYQQALAIAREVGNRADEGQNLRGIGSAIYNQAQYAKNQAQYTKALEFYEQALMIAREVGNRAEEGATLNNIGMVYHNLGQYAKALEFFQPALTIQREVGDRAGEGHTLDNIGVVYDNLGQYAKALEFFQPALTIRREVGDSAGEGVTLNHIGSIHEEQGELQQALNFYQQSIEVHESVRTSSHLEEFKTSLAELSADVYARTLLLLTRLNQSSQAFDLTERARARTFLDQVGNAQFDFRKGADTQLLQQEQALRLELSALDRNLQQERAKPRAQQNAEVIQSLSTQLANKQREYEDLLTRIKLANPEYASLVTVSPLTLSQVQKLLDKNTTLLSYFVTPDKTLAFIVTQDSFQAVELSVSEKDLRAAITEFRGFANLSDSPSLKQLYGWLIATLKQHLKTPVVGIIPHGVLHYIPFAALTDGTHYLGDDYTLSYLPSASALPFIQQKRKESSGGALVLAQSQAEGLPTLRYSDREAQAIAKLYNTQALLGSAATESTFKSRAGDASILHLSAHGQLNTVNSLFSRIILAPDKDADGSLEVHEVYGLDLAKADLVVLSACQTQLGAQSRGDDLIGLNRAFIYAGAPTVIASLWSVDDEATSVLMTAFYTHLKQGKGKAEALRVAQAETRAKYPHPYYWAAFVLTGDAGK